MLYNDSRVCIFFFFAFMAIGFDFKKMYEKFNLQHLTINAWINIVLYGYCEIFLLITIHSSMSLMPLLQQRCSIIKAINSKHSNSTDYVIGTDFLIIYSQMYIQARRKVNLSILHPIFFLDEKCVRKKDEQLTLPRHPLQKKNPSNIGVDCFLVQYFPFAGPNVAFTGNSRV